jgi:ankyrin repeat protein
MRDSTFLRLALEFGGDPDLVHGDQETTPIFDAIVQDDQRNLMLLIEFGADIDARMKTGLTPILSAALGNRYDMVYALLINGADYTIRDDYGFDLAHYVEESRSLIDKGTVRWLQYQEVVDQLQNLGVDIPE